MVGVPVGRAGGRRRFARRLVDELGGVVETRLADDGGQGR
jgi:hypothetical protein